MFVFVKNVAIIKNHMSNIVNFALNSILKFLTMEILLMILLSMNEILQKNLTDFI